MKLFSKLILLLALMTSATVGRAGEGGGSVIGSYADPFVEEFWNYTVSLFSCPLEEVRKGNYGKFYPHEMSLISSRVFVAEEARTKMRIIPKEEVFVETRDRNSYEVDRERYLFFDAVKRGYFNQPQDTNMFRNINITKEATFNRHESNEISLSTSMWKLMNPIEKASRVLNAVVNLAMPERTYEYNFGYFPSKPDFETVVERYCNENSRIFK
ncbi:hypothetical protein K2X30_13750 [bacterium]|nr:hypothetical protein [bacterium]